MSFNPELSKQVLEVLFSNKVTKTNHPNIFNGNTVQMVRFLEEKPTFNDQITSRLTTVNKLISTLRKLYHYMPRDSCHNLQIFHETPPRLCRCYI